VNDRKEGLSQGDGGGEELEIGAAGQEEPPYHPEEDFGGKTVKKVQQNETKRMKKKIKTVPRKGVPVVC